MADLTYPEVGATAGVLPAGYHHVREQRVIGHGPQDFASAVDTLMGWDMHRRAGLRVASGPEAAVAGADVVLSLLGLRIPCRVVYVIDEPRARGFAYGSLPGHPECGEERFVIEHDPTTDEVTGRVVAFSIAGTRLTRVAGPVGRASQRFMTRRYLRALAPR